MFILYFLVGVFSGVIGGMGMGGGTALIPMLTVFFGVGQHEAQTLNLVCFLPMAACSLAVHFKEKRVETKNILYIIIPAALSALATSFISTGLDGDLLKKLFGGFLICLAVYGLISDKNNKM